MLGMVVLALAVRSWSAGGWVKQTDLTLARIEHALESEVAARKHHDNNLRQSAEFDRAAWRKQTDDTTETITAIKVDHAKTDMRVTAVERRLDGQR